LLNLVRDNLTDSASEEENEGVGLVNAGRLILSFSRFFFSLSLPPILSSLLASGTIRP
jgi:hypothetical protein